MYTALTLITIRKSLEHGLERRHKENKCVWGYVKEAKHDYKIHFSLVAMSKISIFLRQGHVICVFALCWLHAVYLPNCSDDTRFTGICFGAGGVIEQSNECFYTQTQSLISKSCVFLVSVRHFVLQGHVGRNNLSLSSYTNEVDWEQRGV